MPNFIFVHMLQRTLPAGFIAPCLPTKTDKLPSGGQWLREIKHDGFRIIARKIGAQVRLYSRPGTTSPIASRSSPRPWLACARAPASSMARRLLATRTALPRSISSGTSALNESIFLYAFDLIELNGDDLSA